MSKLTFLFFIGLLFYSCSTQNTDSGSYMKLWYDAPAEHWEEALPIGNGRLGAMVFGNPGREHLQLNEETVWAGEPGNNLPEGFKEILPEARELLFDGEYKEAEDLIMTRFPRHAPEDNNYGMPYQTVGDLWMEFPGHENVENYYRELDIANALSKVSYDLDGVTYKREYLSTPVDEVMAVRFTASKKGKVGFTMKTSSPHTRKEVYVDGKTLVLNGKGEDRRIKKEKLILMPGFSSI